MPFDAGSIDATLNLDTSSFIAKLQAAQAYADAHPIKIPVDTGDAGVAAAAAGAAGGGGGGSGGLLAALGFGKAASGGAGRIPGIGAVGAGLAGFGTAGGLAGLGLESLLTTGIGLAGSAAGAAAGGAALGLGTAGVLGVGMGTDLAGIGQAAGDIKTTTTALTNLNQAVATYGATSRQAQTATIALNQALAGFSPVAQQAVLAASQTAIQFKAMFDTATGAAEATGANIINQVMQVGEKFLPTIGKFAAENMTIIQSSLQPLFTWIQGPGLAVFTQLEQVFQEHLPTAMHAFTQGIELLIRTLGFLAPYTGNLVDSLDKWLTLLNGADFSKFTGWIATAIGIFRDWEGLIKAVGTAIYELFHHDAGTGTAIVVTLTQMVNKFNEWIQTAQGGQAVTHLLEQHKAEILALLSLLPQLISIFGQIDLVAAPPLMLIVQGLADMAHWILETPLIGQVVAMALAFEFFGNRMKFLNPLLSAFNGLIKDLVMKGLVLLGGALTGLGGPFTALGGWLTGLGTEGVSETAALTTAIEGLTVALGEADVAAAGLVGTLATADVAGAGATVLPGGLIAKGAAGAAEGAAGAGVAEGAGAIATGGAVGTLGAIAAPLGLAIGGVILGYFLSRDKSPLPVKPGDPGAYPQGGAGTTPSRAGGGINYAATFGPSPAERAAAEAAADVAAATAAATYARNVDILSRATGLAQPNVIALAKSLKDDLHTSLSPQQLAAFTGYVKDAGGAAAVVGQQWTAGGMAIHAALIKMSADAEKNMPGVTAAVRNTIVNAQPAILGLVTTLNKGGHDSAAAFITSFIAQIPAAELASKQMHDKMHSPLIPLVNELDALGETSAAKMIQHFIDQQPGAKKASTDLHDSLKNPLVSLETELAASGNVTAAGYIQTYINHHPEAKTAAGLFHDAVSGAITPLEQELYTSGNKATANYLAAIASGQGDAKTAGADLGQAIDEGLASGITVNAGLAINSINGVVQSVRKSGMTGLVAKSPSLFFYELGKNVSQGLALGISDHAHLAVDATNALTMGVRSTGIGVGTGAGASIGGPSGPAVHIDQVVFQDQTDMRAFMNMADFYMAMGKVG